MIAERLKTLKVKNGIELDAEMGPIVTAAALARITDYIAAGVEEGATLVADGRGLSVPAMSKASSWAARCSTT
jgi:malonate-semialdehyde dehydrogenase (acetylating)/methylmalonate-semialdehyde dehydrogenase